MHFRELEQLGEADLSICGLRLWVHGRQFPDATDYWDGNWLRVTAYCFYPDSSVRIRNNPCIRTDEIAGLLAGCERMYATLDGEAGLQCMESYISVQLAAGTNGHIEVRLSISSDHIKESHQYDDEIDQSYLPGIIRSCEALLGKFPIIDPEMRR